jgi:uncharacterized membrane protein
MNLDDLINGKYPRTEGRELTIFELIADVQRQQRRAKNVGAMISAIQLLLSILIAAAIAPVGSWSENARFLMLALLIRIALAGASAQALQNAMRERLDEIESELQEEAHEVTARGD